MTVAVAFEEKLRSDHTLGIDDERPREGNTLSLALRRGVEDIVFLNDLTLGIGQEGEADLRRVGEFLEDAGRIVADSDDLDARLIDRLEVTLQLDQLRAAEWSPVRRTVKDQRDFALLEQVIQRAILALLVLEGEPRSLGTNLQAGQPVSGWRTFLLSLKSRREKQRDARREGE